MSTGADCQFWEASDGRWFYKLQRWPYGENPDYDTYGPFSSYTQAQRHLDHNHANPGGYSITTLADVADQAQRQIHHEAHDKSYNSWVTYQTCEDGSCKIFRDAAKESHDKINKEEEAYYNR